MCVCPVFTAIEMPCTKCTNMSDIADSAALLVRACEQVDKDKTSDSRNTWVTMLRRFMLRGMV